MSRRHAVGLIVALGTMPSIAVAARLRLDDRPAAGGGAAR
jgi:hypothetical protein